MRLAGQVMEAARLDGCSESRILWRIVVPISRPIIITATLLAFVFGWNNFLWPLIVTDSNSKQVLTVSIAALQSSSCAGMLRSCRGVPSLSPKPR
jgi:multiple sugar transport system permease protein